MADIGSYRGRYRFCQRENFVIAMLGEEGPRRAEIGHMLNTVLDCQEPGLIPLRRHQVGWLPTIYKFAAALVDAAAKSPE